MSNSLDKKNIPYIDFAKTYAIISIVLYHFLSIIDLPKLLKMCVWFGGTGIHLFFFLSGFGLSLRPIKSTKHFYSRRFQKVYFPYLIAITIIFIVSEFISLYPSSNLNTYLSHILLYKMFFNNLINSLGGQFWFLSTIFQFYIFFPLIIIFYNKVGDKVFIILSFGLSFLYLFLTSYFDIYERRLSSVFIQYMWEFGLGMSAAKYYVSNGKGFWSMSPYKIIAIVCVSLPVMAGMVLSGSTYGLLLNDFPAFFGYTGLSVLAFLFLQKASRVSLDALIKYTKYSFALYLIHMFILDLLKFQNSAVLSPYLIIIISLMSSLILAKPFQTFSDYLSQKLF